MRYFRSLRPPASKACRDEEPQEESKNVFHVFFKCLESLIFVSFSFQSFDKWTRPDIKCWIFSINNACSKEYQVICIEWQKTRLTFANNYRWLFWRMEQNHPPNLHLKICRTNQGLLKSMDMNLFAFFFKIESIRDSKM